MRVGFTGTRSGMYEEQTLALEAYLALGVWDAGHHGDCVGGDVQFHAICGRHSIPVVLHPPNIPHLRAFCKGAVEVRDELPYLLRNKAIVRETGVLLVGPKENREPEPGRGQGTWSTVRFARRRGKGIMIFWPDGRVERDGE